MAVTVSSITPFQSVNPRVAAPLETRSTRNLERDYFASSALAGSTPDGGSFTGSNPDPVPVAEPVANPSASGTPAPLDPEVFNWQDYLARYPDLREAGLKTEQDAITHWLTYGINERRQASPGFSIQAYLDANPDVKAATSDSALVGIAHFVMYGRAEGRSRGKIGAPGVEKPVPSAPAASAIPPGGLTVGNEVVQLGVAPRTGGAINSLVVDGKEYINDFDHGRQLQVAWQMNYGGEGNNPTEGGSGADGVGPTTSSKVLSASATATGLSVTTMPAWWLAAGDNVPASGEAATNGGSSAATSNQVLIKSVEVGMTVNGVFYPNIVRHDASITFPDGAKFAGMEMPTVYLQGDFDQHYVYDIDSGALTQQPTFDSYGQMQTAYSQDANGPRHRPNPFVLATADGQHAMAIVPALPMPAGFEDQLMGRMSFPNSDPAQATQKMSALMTASNIAPGTTLSATTYVIVGSLAEVQATLEALYAMAR